MVDRFGLKYFIKKRDVNVNQTRHFESISQKKLVVTIIVLSRDLRLLGLRDARLYDEKKKNRANFRGGSHRQQQCNLHVARDYIFERNHRTTPFAISNVLKELRYRRYTYNKHQFHNYLAARIIANLQQTDIFSTHLFFFNFPKNFPIFWKIIILKKNKNK